MINGAAGGVVTSAVQIAKAMGAEVVGVCSASNLAMVRALGADRVLDYAFEDFTRQSGRYDVIFDCIGNRGLADCLHALAPGGRHVIVGGPKGAWLGPAPRALAVTLNSMFRSRKSSLLLTKIRQDDLVALASMLESGVFAPAIGIRFPLDRVPEAIRLSATGHASGKIVIEMSDTRVVPR